MAHRIRSCARKETEFQGNGVAIFIGEENNHFKAQLKLCIRDAHVGKVMLLTQARRAKVTCIYRAPGENQGEGGCVTPICTENG